MSCFKAGKTRILLQQPRGMSRLGDEQSAVQALPQGLNRSVCHGTGGLAERNHGHRSVRFSGSQIAGNAGIACR
jgi:hypothetical protein